MIYAPHEQSMATTHHPPPNPHHSVALAIGNFDGVHQGHQHLLALAKQAAGARGLTLAVLTFSPHPRQVLQPQVPLHLLTTEAEKHARLQALEVGDIRTLAFNAALQQMSPADFVTDILVQRHHAKLVVVGQGFRFGHKAAGDVELLTRLGQTHGFEVLAVPPLADAGGEVVSSSRIRALITQGLEKEARALLGW